MSVRLFSCRRCGHMIRLGARQCGQCDAPAPLANRTNVHVGAVAAAVLLCLLAGLFLLR